MSETYILNDKGQVAMRYQVPAQKYIAGAPSGNAYVYTCKHNISIAFVEERDVPWMLDKKTGCCGNARKKFSVATQAEVDTWLN